MSIHHLLESNFPLGTTEQQSVFDDHPSVSNEGFMDSLKRTFGKKKAPTAKVGVEFTAQGSATGNLEWLEDSLFKADPKSWAFKTDAMLEIGPRYAPFFTRDGKASIRDVAKEVEKDLAVYRRLLTGAKTTLRTNFEYVRKVDREGEQFRKNDPQTNKPDEFGRLLDSWEKNIPTSLVERFSEPNYVFLGYADQKFIEDRTFPDSVAATATRPKYVRALTVDQLPAFIKAIKAVYDFCGEIELLEEQAPLGLDATDPPFRAYAEVFDGKRKMHYLHPTFESLNTDFITQVGHRAGHLLDALTSYARRSLQ